MEKEILSILKHFGWDESFHIPVANEKNKLLECRVEEILNKKTEAASLLADLTDDWKAIKNYYNDIIEQRSQNEKIIYDYKKQLNVEQKINDELQYENNRLSSITEELKKTKKTLIEDNGYKQAQLDKLYSRNKTIRENIKWCQEIEQYWNECVSKENRNVNILEEFNKTDDGEFKLPDKLRQPNLAGGFLNNLATNLLNLKVIEPSVPLLQTKETCILSTQFLEKCILIQKPENCIMNYLLIGVSKLNLASGDWRVQQLRGFKQALSIFTDYANSGGRKLELKRLHLVSEAQEYESILRNKRDAVISVQNNIEKTTKTIENLQKERSWLLDQWKSTGRILKLRSDGIDEIIKETDIVKEVTRNNESKMLEFKNFYKEQIRNNMELEMEVSSFLRIIQKSQMIHQQTIEEMEQKMDEESLKRRELMLLEHLVDQSRINNTVTRRKITGLQDKIKELMTSKENLKNKFNSVKDRSISLCDRIKQLENILTNQKKEYNSFLQERQKLTTSVRMNEHKISRTKDELKMADDELKHFSNLFVKLKKNLRHQHKEKENKSEILADTRQKIGKVKAEIDFMKGEKSVELKGEKENRIIELTVGLESKKKTLDSILRDVNSCNTEIKKLSREINFLLEMTDALSQEKWNLKLMIEGGEKTLMKLIENNNGKEVTENKLRLKANQLENILNQNNGHVQLLEKQKINLETSLQERLLEVQSSTNLLKIRKKALQDEVSTLHRKIDRVNNHMNQLLKKYEIVINSLEKDDMGQPLTISNYKVELVKTRFFLLERGDDLDEKIRKAEKEIKAMENTLLLVDVTNGSLKKINNIVDENGSEWEEKEKLENEYDELCIQAKQQKKLIPEVREIIETLKKNIAEKHEAQQEMLKLRKEKEILVSQLERDLQHQRAKLERVKIRLQNQKARLKSLKQLAALEKGFHLKELQNINKTALAQLTELITANNFLSTPVNTYLTEKGISLPVSTSSKKFSF